MCITMFKSSFFFLRGIHAKMKRSLLGVNTSFTSIRRNEAVLGTMET